jgi:hypothetical protein
VHLYAHLGSQPLQRKSVALHLEIGRHCLSMPGQCHAQKVWRSCVYAHHRLKSLQGLKMTISHTVEGMLSTTKRVHSRVFAEPAHLSSDCKAWHTGPLTSHVHTCSSADRIVQQFVERTVASVGGHLPCNCCPN